MDEMRRISAAVGRKKRKKEGDSLTELQVNRLRA